MKPGRGNPQIQHVGESDPGQALCRNSRQRTRPREETMTAKQKLLACLVLGLIASGILALLDRAFGHSGAAVIGLLMVALFFVICVAVVR